MFGWFSSICSRIIFRFIWAFGFSLWCFGFGRWKRSSSSIVCQCTMHACMVLIHPPTFPRLRLNVCIGGLGITLSDISISWDIHLEINANIIVWICRHLVPWIDTIVECQILFGWSKWCIALVWGKIRIHVWKQFVVYFLNILEWLYDIIINKM
jgi:hypothetical protein